MSRLFCAAELLSQAVIHFKLLLLAGFLPEEYDNFFVKYIYPWFTPTVLFFAGTVGYGVLKYFESEKKRAKADNSAKVRLNIFIL